MSANRVQVGLLRQLISQGVFLAVALILWLRKSCSRAENSDRNVGSFRVVTIEPYGMGDAISLRPLVEYLSKRGISVEIWIQRKWSVIFSDLPVQVHEISAPWSDLGWGGSLRWMWHHRGMLSSQFEQVVGIDPRADCRSTLFLAIAGCSEIIMPNHYLGTDAATPSGPWRVYDDLGCSVPRWRLNLQALEPLGTTKSAESILPPNLEFLIVAPASSKPAMVDVGILPCVPWAGREWPSENWRAFLQKLTARGTGFRVICGPGQRLDAAQMTGVTESEIFEARTLPELALALKSCRTIVSLDSGPLHLAAALDLPIVGIYGPGQLPMWEPSSSHSRVVTRQSEFFEGPIHQIPRNLEISQRMMAAITVDDVLHAYESLEVEIRPANNL